MTECQKRYQGHDEEECCCIFDLEFSEPGEWELEFGEVTIVHTDYDPYLGPYEVVPMAWEQQILPTKDKNMTDNVTVYEVPYAEVSNPEGTTVVIAS